MKLFCTPGNDDPAAKVRQELTELSNSGWQIPAEELAPGGPWQAAQSPMRAYAHNLVSVTLCEQNLNPGFMEFAHVVARLARQDDPIQPLATCLVYVVSDFAQKWSGGWNVHSVRLFTPQGQAPAIIGTVAEALQSIGGYTPAWADGMRSAFARGSGAGAEASARLESVLARCTMQERLGNMSVANASAAPRRRSRAGV